MPSTDASAAGPLPHSAAAKSATKSSVNATTVALTWSRTAVSVNVTTQMPSAEREDTAHLFSRRSFSVSTKFF